MAPISTDVSNPQLQAAAAETTATVWMGALEIDLNVREPSHRRHFEPTANPPYAPMFLVAYPLRFYLLFLKV